MANTRQTRKTAAVGWPQRGEIYLAALDPAAGHEIRQTRPVLIVQNDTSNRYSAVTMVAPITSTVRLPLSPLHVLLPADSSTGLAVASVAVFNQIRTLDGKRLIKKLGAIDTLMLAQVDEAIRVAFSLPLSDSPATITNAISEAIGSITTGRYEP